MAFPNDMSRIAAGLAKLENSNSEDYDDGDDGPAKASRNMIRKTYLLEKAVDGATSTTLAANAAPCFRAPRAGRVLGTFFVPRGTATASNVNYATINFERLDGTGNVGDVFATSNTQPTANGGVGNIATSSTVTIAISNATLAQYSVGSLIAPSYTKTGAGAVLLPAGTWVIDVEEEGVDGYGV